MSTLLLFGFAPLPVEQLRMSGPSLRTWHLLSALLAAGHDVRLIANRGHGIYPDDMPTVTVQQKGQLTYVNVTNEVWATSLAPLVATWAEGCTGAIGATTSATATAAEHIGSLPLWADLYGSLMAEAQAKAVVYGDDDYLRHFWNTELRAIQRGDAFSCVSERQSWMLLGELASCGRLNYRTAGYDFTTVIPVAAETTPYVRESLPRQVRGVTVPADAFIILFTGGYNTWTDGDTLFTALEQVMARHPHVYFVSTGGAIAGHDLLTYTRFTHAVAASPYRDRMKLQGWVASADLPSYYMESDLAVNVDRYSYEAQLGSRTRILEWLRAELPCVITDLPELGAAIVAAGAGLAYVPEDSGDLAQCLHVCIANPAATKSMGRKGRQLLLEKYTFAATTTPLLQWAEHPTHAPDYGQPIPDFHAVHAVTHYNQVAATATISDHSLPIHAALRVWKAASPWLSSPLVQPLKNKLASYGKHVFQLDRPMFACQYHHYTMLEKLFAGKVYHCTVTVENTGTVLWQCTPAAPHTVLLTYRWCTAAGTRTATAEATCVLPHAVRPRQSVIIPVTLATPEYPDHYQLEVDMQREQGFYFRDSGSTGLVIAIDVLPPPPPRRLTTPLTAAATEMAAPLAV